MRFPHSPACDQRSVISVGLILEQLKRMACGGRKPWPELNNVARPRDPLTIAPTSAQSRPAFKTTNGGETFPATPPEVVSTWRSEPWVPEMTHPRFVTTLLPTLQHKGVVDGLVAPSTHIIPAAFPRLGPDVLYPDGCDAESGWRICCGEEIEDEIGG